MYETLAALQLQKIRSHTGVMPVEKIVRWKDTLFTMIWLQEAFDKEKNIYPLNGRRFTDVPVHLMVQLPGGTLMYQ